MLPELGYHPVRLSVDFLGGELLEDGRTMATTPGGPFGHSCQQVGHEVGAAPLPTGSGKHRGDGGFQPLLSIGDDQFLTIEALAFSDLRKASAAYAPLPTTIRSRSGSQRRSCRII